MRRRRVRAYAAETPDEAGKPPGSGTASAMRTAVTGKLLRERKPGAPGGGDLKKRQTERGKSRRTAGAPGERRRERQSTPGRRQNLSEPPEQNEGQREGASGSPSFRSGYSGPKNSHKGSQRRNQRGGRGGGFQMDRRKKIFLIVGGVILALILFIAAATLCEPQAVWKYGQRGFRREKGGEPGFKRGAAGPDEGPLDDRLFGVDSREKGGEMNVGRELTPT